MIVPNSQGFWTTLWELDTQGNRTRPVLVKLSPSVAAAIESVIKGEPRGKKSKKK
ncbi:hypothetical protein D3C80_802930 [compost metagenome]